MIHKQDAIEAGKYFALFSYCIRENFASTINDAGMKELETILEKQENKLLKIIHTVFWKKELPNQQDYEAIKDGLTSSKDSIIFEILHQNIYMHAKTFSHKIMGE